jgi:hypothetical protein
LKRLKGLEPSTFCMARGGEATERGRFSLQIDDIVSVGTGSGFPVSSVGSRKVPGAKPVRLGHRCACESASIPAKRRSERMITSVWTWIGDSVTSAQGEDRPTSYGKLVVRDEVVFGAIPIGHADEAAAATEAVRECRPVARVA